MIESDRDVIFSSLSFLGIWHGYDTVWYVSDVTSGVSMVTKSPSLRWTSFFPRDVTVRVLMVMIAVMKCRVVLAIVYYIHPS